MTFRIDRTSRRGDRWLVDVKGLDGAGVYGVVATNEEGRGLFEVEFCPLLTVVRELIAPDDLVIESGLSEERVRQIVAAALDVLGWGPEVDQAGRIIG